MNDSQKSFEKMNVKELRSYITNNKLGKNLGSLKKVELSDIIRRSEQAEAENEDEEQDEDNIINNFVSNNNSPEIPKINIYYTFTQDQLLTLIQALEKARI